MTFKNERSLRSMCSQCQKIQAHMGDRQPSHLFQVDMADNLFQSSFALGFQDSISPRHCVGSKVGLRVDTQWGERATQRGTTLVDTESGAQSTYSVDLGDGDTCLRKVEKPSCVSGRPLTCAKSLNRMQGGA